MIYVVAVLAAVPVAFWIFHPVYVRWRDYLQHAPELQDASFRTKALVLFKGLRTKMLARLMDGLGIALPFVNAAGEWLGGGGIDLNGILPAIPLLGTGADGQPLVLTATQYSPLIFLGLGRLTDYLRNHTTTAPNTIDPSLAVQIAGQSSLVTGDMPSPALAAIVDPKAPVVASADAPAPAAVVPAAEPAARRRRRPSAKKRRAAKRKAKRKAA